MRVRAQVMIKPRATRAEAIPGTPTRPATRSPGNSSRARTGSSANLAGSTVSSTPKTNSDISSQPSVSAENATTVTSAVSSSEVNRSAHHADQHGDHDAERVHHPDDQADGPPDAAPQAVAEQGQFESDEDRNHASDSSPAA